MTKDDIETFESRLQDKTSFENLAIFAFSAATPLGIDKFVSYLGDNKPANLAIVIVCLAGLFFGGIFQLIAWRRRKKVESYKERLFKQERLLSRTFSVVESSSQVPPLRAI